MIPALFRVIRALLHRHTFSLFWLRFGALLCAVCAIISACRKSPEAPVASGGPSLPITLPAVPTARLSADGLVKVAAAELSGGQLKLQLELTSHTQLPTQPAVFHLTLPSSTTQQSVRLTQFSAGGTSLLTTTTQVRQAFELRSQGFVRHHPIFTLTLRSEFWQPVRGRASKGPVQVTLSIPWSAATVAPASAEKPLGSMAVLAHLVANPAQLPNSFVAEPPLTSGIGPLQDPRQLAPTATAWGRIPVSADGLYRLTSATLQALGLPPSMRLGDLRIFSAGRPVPTLAVPGGLAFYGFASSSPESRTQVYWVAAGPALPAARFASPPLALTSTTLQHAPPATLLRTARIDRDQELKVQHGNFLSIKGVTWVDQEILTTAPLALGLQAPHALPAAPGAEYAARLNIFCDGDPAFFAGTQLALRAGSATLATFSIAQAQEYQFNAKLPARLFTQGAVTTLTLAVIKSTSATLSPDDEDSVWFDNLEVTYPAQPGLVNGHLAFDKNSLTSNGLYRVALDPAQTTDTRLVALAINPDGQQVTQLTPLSAAEPLQFPVVRQGAWRTEIIAAASAMPTTITLQTFSDACLKPVAPSGTDYLIITHHQFQKDLQPLLDLNRRRGLATQVVDVQSLYDLFSQGRLSSDAIRNYLAYTLKAWGIAAPEYVLLVGDASSDFLNETRSEIPNFVPSHTYAFGSDAWASDYWYTCVAGGDNLGDFVIGRLSATNSTDLAAMIAKTVQYADKPLWGPWRGSMAYVADNLEGFREAAERVRESATPAAIGAERVYLDNLPLEDNWYIPKSHIERVWAQERSWMKVSGAATLKIRNLFNAGVAQLDFFGHGSPNIWTDERIWFGGDSPNRDSLSLKSDGRYPFVLNFTCNSGAIDYSMAPWNVCISEDLLRTPQGGAVGLFVPSGPGTTSIHEQLAALWRKSLFSDNLRQVGVVGTLTRERFALTGGSLDMVYTYNLLGDPALELQLTQRWHNITLDPSSAAPGTAQVTASLAELAPRSGQAVAWVVDASGESVWQGEPFAYSGGRLQLKVPVPTAAALPAHWTLRLYGWNEQARADWVAEGEFSLGNPGLRLLTAQLQAKPDSPLAVEYTLQNLNLRPGIAQLKLVSATGQALEEWSDNLTATPQFHATRKLNTTFPAGAPIFARLALAQPAVDSLAEPLEQSLQLAVLPPAPWCGFDPLACLRLISGGRPALQVRVLAAQWPSTGSLSLIWQQQAQTITTSPLALFPTGGQRAGQTQLYRPPAPPPAPNEQIILRQAGHAQPLATLPVDSVATREPVLRIIPNSIHHSPEHPTDGETIHITFDVENIGQAPSASTAPVLLPSAPGPAAAQPLPQQTGDLRRELPPLGPGRKTTLTLRWDPIRNAGVQTIWIDLKGVTSITDPDRKQQIASYRLFVRTKANLVRQRVFASRAAGDEAAHRIRLHCGLANEGETDAGNVLVTFFKSEDKSPESRLGMITLEKVAARGTAEAILVWEYDPAVETPETLKNMKIYTEVRLKGSSRRLAE